MQIHLPKPPIAIKAKFKYKPKFGWTTVLGILSFGALVPSFFIPIKLWTKEHLLSIVASTVITSIIWEGSKFIQSIISYYLPWERSITRRLTFEILSIFVFTTITLIIGLLTYNQIASSIAISIGVILRNIFVSFALALLFTAISEGTFLFNKWKASLVEQERLKKEALEAKLESLKKQLDPHFLFNSLSVLSGVVHSDPDLADTFITKLSQVYRYVIDHNEEKLVPLEKELEFVASYIFLLDVRFRGKVRLQIDSSLKHLQSDVLPLSLQLLVENAIKHNKLTQPLELKVHAEQDHVWVEHNLQKREDGQVKSTGIGLNNLRNRYALIAGKPIHILNNGIVFKVGLPIIAPRHESIDN